MANLSPQERMRRGPELSAAVGAVVAAMDRVAELRALERRIKLPRGRPRQLTQHVATVLPLVEADKPKRRGRTPKQ